MPLRAKITFPILLALTWPAYACELTDEYKAARTKARLDSDKPYEQCTSSVASYFYWQAYTECEAQQMGKNVGGGCAHVAGYTSADARPKNADEHCDILKTTIEQKKKYLQYLIESQSIKKCK